MFKPCTIPNLEPSLAQLQSDRVVQLLANQITQSGALNMPLIPASTYISPLSLLQASVDRNSNRFFTLPGVGHQMPSLESIPLPSISALPHQTQQSAAMTNSALDPIAPFRLPLPPYAASPLLSAQLLLAKKIQTELAIQKFQNEYTSIVQNFTNSRQLDDRAESSEESKDATQSAMEPIESNSDGANSSIMTNAQSERSSKRGAQSKRKTFPRVLYEMLQEQYDNDSGIVSWLPDGTGFIIHSKTEFEKVLLEKQFKGIKFRSFQRQLNIYGFTRLEECELHSYKHEFFVRDQQHLIDYIKRVPIKK